MSPFIAGRTIKGPAAKLMNELGYPVGAEGLMQYYRELVDAIVFDIRDGEANGADNSIHFQTDTLMVNAEARINLANFCIGVVDQLARSSD